MHEMIEIDGSEGEGGGQVLRSSLALSMITGTPLRIWSIRAKRKRPGLLRQHLTAVQAATRCCGATVRGDRLGSSELWFTPGAIVHGTHRFAVGTAGSSTLVLQTVLWPLLHAPGESIVEVEGGTHNPLAPPFEFFDRVLVPHLEMMGASIALELVRPGFYPAGGGCIRMHVAGGRTLEPLSLIERGPIARRHARALVSNLPLKIAHRELNVVRKGWALGKSELEAAEVASPGPGNVLTLEAEFATGREVFTGFGEKGVTAERVAESTLAEATRWEALDVPVGEHLADQLLIPMALAGSGRFRTGEPSQHTRTHAAIIGRFLDVAVSMTPDEGQWLVTIGNPRH
jgi:RNA 3'-terminal phosphate cyclase (ATP)